MQPTRVTNIPTGTPQLHPMLPNLFAKPSKPISISIANIVPRLPVPETDMIPPTITQPLVHIAQDKELARAQELGYLFSETNICFTTSEEGHIM